MDRRSWKDWLSESRHVSILVKVGAIFILLSATVGIFIFTASNLTRQLIGVSKQIEQAGTERMRIYRLASLIQQLTPTSDNERASIRNEIAQFERVVEGLRFGTPEHGSVAAISPTLSSQLQDLHVRWSMQLRPALERAQGDNPSAVAVREYLIRADDFMVGWDSVVQSLEQESVGRLRLLYQKETWFLVTFFGLMGAALIFLNRVVREPLKRLTADAEQLAAGKFHTDIQIHARDELGQLALTFRQMAETIRYHIGELNALHATGQEIATLGPGGLEDALRRIADRAAESLEADLAVVMVRHSTMQCWVVEAASGKAFDRVRKQILLFEETPFSNQAFETKRPVVVADLSAHHGTPIRFRDEFGAKSSMIVPLLGPHECPGVLVLLSIARVKQFTEWDVQVAQQFGAYAAVTMENARLFDAIETESQDVQARLHEVEGKVAELTHEVKAPAGRVAEFASWIERDFGRQLDGKGLQYLSWIKKEGKDLAALAERTLDLARINCQPSPLERVDVDSVVREVLALLEKDCVARGVRVSIASDLPCLACRRIHVKQVFENLIGNAIKYMGHQAHPSVEIGWLEDNRGVSLFVRDNGMGIEPAMIDRIFLPFIRLGTGEVAGSGIGLSIVKTVVEQYEGSVNVDSIPGVGSTFYVHLPVILWKPTPPGSQAQSVESPTLDEG